MVEAGEEEARLRRKPGVNKEAGENCGKEQGLPAGKVTSKLRRGSPARPGAHSPLKRLRLTLRRDLSPSATFHQKKSYGSSYCSGHEPTSWWLSAGSQASPPAHRVQDRREVPSWGSPSRS